MFLFFYFPYMFFHESVENKHLCSFQKRLAQGKPSPAAPSVLASPGHCRSRRRWWCGTCSITLLFLYQVLKASCLHCSPSLSLYAIFRAHFISRKG